MDDPPGARLSESPSPSAPAGVSKATARSERRASLSAGHGVKEILRVAALLRLNALHEAARCRENPGRHVSYREPSRSRAFSVRQHDGGSVGLAGSERDDVGRRISRRHDHAVAAGTVARKTPPAAWRENAVADAGLGVREPLRLRLPDQRHDRLRQAGRAIGPCWPSAAQPSVGTGEWGMPADRRCRRAKNRAANPGSGEISAARMKIVGSDANARIPTSNGREASPFAGPSLLARPSIPPAYDPSTGCPCRQPLPRGT